jgi:predicted enzyme related to lactoylglutathione lyase
MLGPVKTVGIYVSDQAKSVDFYVDILGFEVRRRMQMATDAEWVEVGPPGAETCLVIYPRDLMADWTERKPSIVFYCADVAGTVAESEARGVHIAMPPAELPWETFAAIEDPDANLLGMTDQAIAYQPELPGANR